MSSLREPSWRVGGILGPTGDSVWFLGLPFIAVAAGLACQELLQPVRSAVSDSSRPATSTRQREE